MPQLIEDLIERAVELAHYTAEKIEELGISNLGMVLSGFPKDVIVNHAAETGPISFLLEPTKMSVGDGFCSAAWQKRYCVRPRAQSKCSALRLSRVASPARREYSSLAAHSIASRPWSPGTEVRILSVVE